MRSKNLGQVTIEIIIASAIFSLLALSIAPVIKDISNTLVNGTKKQEAVYLAQEGLEAVQAIAQNNFSELKKGSYGIKALNGRWELLEKNQKENGFWRQINIENYAPFEKTKDVQAKIEWARPQFKENGYFALSEIVPNPNIFALNLNSSSYLIGNPSPWQGKAYTIILSVKPKSVSQKKGAGLFANQDASQGKPAQSLQIESDGNSNYQLRIGKNTFLIGSILDRWTQLIITWDGSVLKTYYNGKKIISQNLPSEQGNTLFKAYLLGTSSEKTKNFAGLYKNLIIFKRALNKEEALDIFSGKLPSLEGLELYWKMDEGKENLVKDYGPFNVSGNIVGQPLWTKILTLSSFKEVGNF